MSRSRSSLGAAICLLSVTVLLAASSPVVAAEKLKVLIIDGQQHQWQKTTPLLDQMLQKSGRFVADVATAPKSGDDMKSFRPKFADYDVVVSNYNGDRWPEETEADFVEYLKNGGGFVSVHAADNAFATWPEYNEAIGLGGWSAATRSRAPTSTTRTTSWWRAPTAAAVGMGSSMSSSSAPATPNTRS